MDTIDAIKAEDVDITLLKTIPLPFAKSNYIFPIKTENSELIGAVVDERGLFALSEASRALGLKARGVKATPDAILEAINRFYGQLGSAEEVMGTIAGEDLSSVATEFEAPRDLLELTEEAPIIRLLNALLLQAVKERASDIHVEPYEKEIEVRLRIDGILHRVLSPPKIIQEALISRIKIMSSLDIAEKRLPQDGRIRLLLGGKDIDIRVSIVPTCHGERAVLRLLDRKQGVLGLREIGFTKEEEAVFEEYLSRPDGIVLVTGPTGSGKTTTLYAALNRIHSEEKNIITVEDPIEYELKGIGQIHVNPRIGLTFASGLRSILRQDPDVIMVGEIRDIETAEIAMQASLTGHLVLSTLHTNDAPSALIRLIDMGVEPFLVASSLTLVLAQRLVRRICPFCKVPFTPSEAEIAYFPEPPGTLYRGEGCERCKGKGYHGRTGIFELLPIDNPLRPLISERTDSQTIKKYAVGRGMKTLRSDGIEKVRSGVTTLEEVLRVSQKDYADISV
jgi:general secretion pathway protein E